MQFTFSEKYKDNVILKETFEFAVLIILFTNKLQESKNFVLANQILKSGTSIGANVKEAQNAESAADFIHKMKIALKEADETEYWLFLCQTIEGYPQCIEELNKLNGILKILNKIISTSKKK